MSQQVDFNSISDPLEYALEGLNKVYEELDAEELNANEGHLESIEDEINANTYHLRTLKEALIVAEQALEFVRTNRNTDETPSQKELTLMAQCRDYTKLVSGFEESLAELKAQQANMEEEWADENEADETLTAALMTVVLAAQAEQQLQVIFAALMHAASVAQAEEQEAVKLIEAVEVADRADQEEARIRAADQALTDEIRNQRKILEVIRDVDAVARNGALEIYRINTILQRFDIQADSIGTRSENVQFVARSLIDQLYAARDQYEASLNSGNDEKGKEINSTEARQVFEATCGTIITAFMPILEEDDLSWGDCLRNLMKAVMNTFVKVVSGTHNFFTPAQTAKDMALEVDAELRSAAVMGG